VYKLIGDLLKSDSEWVLEGPLERISAVGGHVSAKSGHAGDVSARLPLAERACPLPTSENETCH
ncbi:MAG: hypothetical protein AAGK74_16040, partial [Chloroflexota bacterium]